MSAKSAIEWADSTINFWSGCTKVSAGCAHCYAEARDKRHMIEKVDHWGPGAPRLKSVGAVKNALAMNRKPWICNCCGEAFTIEDGFNHRHGSIIPTGHRRRVFSLSLGDWLDPEVPIVWLEEMLGTIHQCDQLQWILCTKRPEWFYGRLEALQNSIPDSEFKRWLCLWGNGHPPKNVWLLASVENQVAAEERIPELLRIPAVVHGLSCEPLLFPVDLKLWAPGIDWVIAGGESGPDARSCNIDWIWRAGPSGANPIVANSIGAGHEGRERGGSHGEGNGAEAHGSTAEFCEVHVGNAERPGCGGQRDARSRPVRRNEAFRTSANIFAPGPGAIDHWTGIVTDHACLAPAVEPGFRVLADGMAMVVDESRADQLRCSGNGVVPLQAAVALVELLRRANLITL